MKVSVSKDRVISGLFENDFLKNNWSIFDLITFGEKLLYNKCDYFLINKFLN
jgi:hypothetical protein